MTQSQSSSSTQSVMLSALSSSSQSVPIGPVPVPPHAAQILIPIPFGPVPLSSVPLSPKSLSIEAQDYINQSTLLDFNIQPRPDIQPLPTLGPEHQRFIPLNDDINTIPDTMK